jgi:glycosyltransferase involved in cell wall biosynthesis
MSGPSSDFPTQDWPSEEHDRAKDDSQPVVGILSNDVREEDVIGAILRAQKAGYDVLVAHSGNEELEYYANRLRAETVYLQEETDYPTEKKALTTTAKTQSYSGLIIHDDPTKEINYEQSRERLDETFATEAVYSSVDTTEIEVVVGIPAYNEADTIGEVVEGAKNIVDEVIVVDDGSTDSTVRKAKAANAEVVEHQENQGYGQALQTIFEQAAQRDVEHLAIIDADGQHDVSDIPKLLQKQDETGAQIVIGSRFVKDSNTKVPLYRRLGLRVVNGLTNISFSLLGRRPVIKDTQSGFRVYDRQAITSLAETDEISDGMGASTDILHYAHQQDYEFSEVGTTVDYEVDDANSRHPLAHGFVLISNLLHTIERERPITVLGIPGFLCTIVGLGFGHWTVTNYISSGLFPTGIALVSMSFILAGIFMIFTAIILHSLNTHFE